MTRRPRILVADDDAALLQALRKRLESLDVDVITATDGYCSLAQARRHQPDLLILDVNMPAGDGFSVQERLREIDGMATVPVIYLTGDQSERLDVLADEIGGFALLHKPFNVKELLSVIVEALRPKAA